MPFHNFLVASDPIIFALIAVPVGAYYFISGFHKWSCYNTISNTPTSKVEAIAAGFIEVYGEVLPKGEYLKGPFFGEDCVFYSYTIEEYRSHGKHSSWDVIRRGQSDAPFFVQDETGKIEIDPGGAEFEVVDRRQVAVQPGESTPKIREFLAEINLADNVSLVDLGPIHLGANLRRYTEYVLEKGQKIFATGTAVPKEGVGSEKQEEMLVIKKGDFNRFFYISDREEKGVLGGMRNNAILYLAGGGLAALIGLAYIFFRMNIL